MHAEDSSKLLSDKQYNQLKKDRKRFRLKEIIPLNAFNKPVTEVKYFHRCMQLQEIQAHIIAKKKDCEESGDSSSCHTDSEPEEHSHSEGVCCDEGKLPEDKASQLGLAAGDAEEEHSPAALLMNRELLVKSLDNNSKLAEIQRE